MAKRHCICNVEERRTNKLNVIRMNLRWPCCHRKNVFALLTVSLVLRSADRRHECSFFSTLDLKNRYEDVFAEFQRLPLRPETTCSLTAKVDLTNALIEIERDIEFLEKHPHIFIENK